MFQLLHSLSICSSCFGSLKHVSKIFLFLSYIFFKYCIYITNLFSKIIDILKQKLIYVLAYNQMHTHNAAQPCNTRDCAMYACMCSSWFTQYKASLSSTKCLYGFSADTFLIYFVINLLTKWTETFFLFSQRLTT